MEYVPSGGAGSTPQSPVPSGTGYQPIFSADGRVCEYALPDTPESHAPPPDDAHAAMNGLRAALLLFRQGSQGIPLSFGYDSPAGVSSWSARAVCAELNLSLDQNRLRLHSGQADESMPDLSYPASLFTLNIPMAWDLLPDAELFRNRHDFAAGLRVRIGPTLVDGRPASHGVLRVAGVHMKIPRGFSQHPMLHARFFSLLQRAQAFKLPVLIMGTDDATDFHWMRAFPNLMFQGELLSSRIGADSLDLMLAMGGDRWRDFKVGSRYP
ncbi:hypothetical protein LMG26858_00183 [Achromobacter anxifer]|uniref:Uncharacterized protein n=2 Tax=Achromobacter anxifer TaxID=1287737 RepID=A0A6S7BWD8_9BURK|nr:hypothetical protein [Achromobacter anxifer]CAB3820778.1 hypothetical protein LMG26858_00183 [Achromobacter anxifer]CAB5513179.1 hypothetical protein LMG26857_02456 [Achromobacter anxifer]